MTKVYVVHTQCREADDEIDVFATEESANAFIRSERERLARMCGVEAEDTDQMLEDEGIIHVLIEREVNA
jgi:hypothetical protein